jgi:hypothetical protein
MASRPFSATIRSIPAASSMAVMASRTASSA